jgi:hypothetical protein
LGARGVSVVASGIELWAALIDGDVAGAGSAAFGALAGSAGRVGFKAMRGIESIQGRYGPLSDLVAGKTAEKAVTAAVCTVVKGR